MAILWLMVSIYSTLSLKAQQNEPISQIAKIELDFMTLSNLDSLEEVLIGMPYGVSLAEDKIKDYLLAYVFYYGYKFGQSESLIKPILDDSLNTISDKFLRSKALKLKADLLYAQKKYREVDPFCKEWLELADPNQEDYLYDKSCVLFTRGNAISWQYEHPQYRELCWEYYTASYKAIEQATLVGFKDDRYRNHFIDVGSEYGTIISLFGDVVGAIKHTRELINKVELDGQASFEELMTAYFAIGLSYSKIGDYEQSDLYLDQIIEYLEKYPEKQCGYQYGPKLSYKALNGLWSGDYQSGIDAGKKALLKDTCLVRAARSMLHNNIGHCYASMLDFDHAISHLDSSMRIAVDGDTLYYNLAIPTRTRGYLYNDFGMYDEAIVDANTAYKYFKKINLDREYIVCETILAEAFMSKGLLDTSQILLENIIAKLGFDHINEYNNQPRNYGDKIIKNLVNYAALQDSFYNRSGDNQYAIKRGQILNNVFEIIDYRMSNINSDASVITFLNRYIGLTEKCIVSDLNLYDLSGDEKYLFAGLNKADRHKSKLAIRNNMLMDQDLFADGNRSIHEEWKLYNEENRKIFNKLLTERDSTEIITLKDRQFLVKDKIDKLESELKDNNKVYNAYLANLDYVAYKEQLSEDELDVLLFEGQEKLYCFYISKEVASYEVIPWSDNCRQLLSKMSADPTVLNDTQNISTITASLQPLLNELASFPSLKYLSIVPDGSLNLIPLELLSYEDGMLLDHYVVSYTSSLRLKSNNTKKSRRGKGLACFVPSYDRSINTFVSDNDKNIYASLVRSGEYELPGAQAESEAISQVWGGESYVGSAATENNFRNLATDYNIMHLAMHAYGDHSSPLNSKLVFTQNKTADDEEDNYLYMHELINLDLNTDLVVLSACSTGTGKIEKGEGVLSLSKAFTAAGAASVVHSLWKVPDQATSHIMIEFYRNLKEGQRKDEALHHAKLNYLNDETVPASQKTPYHWAGFVVTGDMSPIESSNIALWFWIIIATLLFGTLLLLLQKYKASRLS